VGASFSDSSEESAVAVEFFDLLNAEPETKKVKKKNHFF
jgi:hypothetical protein